MDPGILSLNDLCGIRTGIYVKNLKKQIEIATEHIMQCEVTDLILLTGLNFQHLMDTSFFQLGTALSLIFTLACKVVVWPINCWLVGLQVLP